MLYGHSDSGAERGRLHGAPVGRPVRATQAAGLACVHHRQASNGADVPSSITSSPSRTCRQETLLVQLPNDCHKGDRFSDLAALTSF